MADSPNDNDYGFGPVPSLKDPYTKPSSGSSTGSSSSSGFTGDTNTQIQSFLDQMNWSDYSSKPTVAQITQLIKTTDPDALKTEAGVSKALTSLANQYQWTPNAAGTQNQLQSIMSPLAIQLFYQNNIAPYMKSLNQQTGALAQQISNQNYSDLPAQYQAVEKAGNQNQAQDLQTLMLATQAAGLEQPQIDNITSLLSNAYKSNLQSYDRALENSAITAPGGSTGGIPTGL